tara:strand:- start:12967 stop:15204 length:2238 start_codon:yes stop_codon:yes gene_type:complete
LSEGRNIFKFSTFEKTEKDNKKIKKNNFKIVLFHFDLNKKYRLIKVVFKIIIIFSLLLISRQGKSELTTLYPVLISTFSTITEEHPKQCLNRNLTTYQTMANKCLEDICGTANQSSKDLLTSHTLEEKIKPEYVKSIDEKKDDIIELIQQRNNRTIKNINEAIDALESLPSQISINDPQAIIKSFIQIKNNNGINKVELSPVLYETGILSKQEFDQLKIKIIENKNYSNYFSLLYGGKPGGDRIGRHDKRGLKNRCKILKRFNFNCEGNNSLSNKYQEKLSDPKSYHGDFNFYARDHYDESKRKNKHAITKNPKIIHKRLQHMLYNRELLSDQSLIEQLNKLSENPESLDDTDVYLNLEERFFSNILPLPEDGIDFNLMSVHEVSGAVDNINKRLEPLELIKNLRKRKAQVQALDIEKQFENMKLDLLMANQQAWKNREFKNLKSNMEKYKNEFLEKMRKINSQKSFAIIKQRMKKIRFDYLVPKFDWFGLKLRDWKKETLPETINALDKIYQGGADSVSLTIKRITNDEYQDARPLAMANMLHQLNKPDLLGIESIFTKPVVDAYNPMEKELKASSFTCSDHRDSKGIFFHELGHFFSDTFNTEKLSITESSKKDFYTSRKCVSAQYKKHPAESIHSDGSPFKFEGDHIYTEEDFADYISSLMQKGKSGSTYCSILEYSRDLDGNIFYSDSNFIMKVNDMDPHSTALKRVLYDVLQRGSLIPTSCQTVMQQHLADFNFSGCVNE